MDDTLNAIIAQADAAIARNPQDFETFLAVRPLFEEIISRRLYLEGLHRLLRENLDNAREVLPDISFGQYVVIAIRPHSTWSIIQHPRRTEKLYMVPNCSLSARISQSRLRVQRFRAPMSLAEGLVESGSPLTACGPEEPGIGEVFARDGRLEAIDLQGLDAAPALTFRVNTALFGDYEWTVDRASLRPNRAFTLRERESFIVTIFDLLGAARAKSSLEPLEGFVDHPLHFVRWKAIQTVAQIDRGRGLELVSKSVSDPHPQIRAAAAATLAQV